MNMWIGEDLLKPGGKKIYSEIKKKKSLALFSPFTSWYQSAFVVLMQCPEGKAIACKQMHLHAQESFVQGKAQMRLRKSPSSLKTAPAQWVLNMDPFQHCPSAQAQLFRTNPTSIKHQEVSDGNGVCSEETEQLTKPTLSKASVISLFVCWSLCVCYCSSGLIFSTETKFELGMDFCRCQMRFPREFSVQNTRVGYVEQISTLLVWDITVTVPTGSLYVGVDGTQQGLVCASAECEGLRTGEQCVEIKKKS